MPRDERPAVWVGHVSLPTRSVSETREFMIGLGMRPIAQGDDFAVLELRGGTHLVLLRSEDFTPGPAPFDLMVEDLDAVHQRFRAQGLAPSEIEVGRIHRSFRITSPCGHTIVFNSSHVSDLPV